MKLPTAIFREYDIRGTVGDQLTAEVGRAIGQAVATLGWQRLGRAPRLAVGRDNRPSGPALAHGLLSGIEAVGGHGVDVGEMPTPALYFATHVLNRSEEHTSELQSRVDLVCRLLLEKKKKHIT